MRIPMRYITVNPIVPVDCAEVSVRRLARHSSKQTAALRYADVVSERSTVGDLWTGSNPYELTESRQSRRSTTTTGPFCRSETPRSPLASRGRATPGRSGAEAGPKSPKTRPEILLLLL